MRVLQVAESLDPKFGGTAVAIRQLANELAARGIEVTILVTGSTSCADSLLPQIRICECRPIASRTLGFAIHSRRELVTYGKADLVHIHGLWRLNYAKLARFAAKRGIPVLLSTHGMLEAPALQHHGWRKRAARILYQDAVLKGVQCLHATARLEAETLRRLGFDVTTAVIPWGIDIRPIVFVLPRTAQTRRVAFFLSRFHPIKGLDLLLKAWAAVEKIFPDWDLLLAGYDEDGYRTQLEVLADSLSIRHRVIFRGPIHDSEKDLAFAEAELFVMTSRSENFGLAVGEAMAHGIPVITTTGTPWSRIAEWGCGWCVEPNVEAIIKALTESLQQPRPMLRQMGERARELISKTFSIAATGQAMLELYSWLLGNGQRPTSIMAD